MTGAPLALTVSFPTGYFFAHERRGRAEWPPAPVRILCAMLAASYTLGDDDGVRVVRACFHLAPPSLRVPPAGRRDVDSRRWVPVPVDAKVKMNGSFTLGDRDVPAPILKEPERGMHVGGGAVTLTFPDCSFTESDLGVLDEVLRAVTYVGRPTSPAVIARLSQAAAPDPGLEVWEPDASGAARLRVGTPDFLTALDRREAARRAGPDPNWHPPLGGRPSAPYRVYRSGSCAEGALTAAEVDGVCDGLVYVRTPGARPDDLPTVIDALETADRTGQASAQPRLVVVPDLGTDRGAGRPAGRTVRSTPRLYGVACLPRTGQVLDARTVCAVAGGLVDLAPSSVPRGRTRLSRFERAVARSWGTWAAWTTVVPCRLGPDALREAVLALAEDRGAGLVGAQTHAVGRDLAPDVPHHPGLGHVTIQFDRPVRGPLILDGAVMAPVESEVKENPSVGE